jgi:type II secretory pathway pseudopilin PulG
MIISARLVVMALLASIVAITTISIQTFTNTASAEPQQNQERQLQLATVASNTNNANGNNHMSISSPASSSSPFPTMNISPNIQTDFNPNATYSRVSKFAYIDPFILVIGDCEIGKLVLVAPFAVCRGDEGIPIHIGNYLIYKMV